MTNEAFKAAWHDRTVRMNDDETTLLVQAYRWHKQALVSRYRVTRNGLKSIPTTFAIAALDRARADVTARKRRYPHGICPAVSWQPRERGIAFIENPERAGLRLVGRVEADCGRNGVWDIRETSGWYTDPDGDTFRDGTGLCWGVVYQLPTRKGKARFVAGYVMGGCSDDWPIVDLGNVFEARTTLPNPQDQETARDAAYQADAMAQRAAEEEREYQTAWRAGSIYADTIADIETSREHVKGLLAERKEAMANAESFPSICATIRNEIRRTLTNIEELRNKRDKLKEGECSGLMFWNGDSRLCDAFNEGASADVL